MVSIFYGFKSLIGLFCCMHQAGFIGLLDREDSIPRRFPYFWSSFLSRVLKPFLKARDLQFVHASRFSRMNPYPNIQARIIALQRLMVKVKEFSSKSFPGVAFPCSFCRFSSGLFILFGQRRPRRCPTVGRLF